MDCKFPKDSRSYRAYALCSKKDICKASIIIYNITTLLSANEAL